MKRLAAVAAIVLAAAGIAYAVTASGSEHFFDPNINHEVELEQAQQLRAGTSRRAVERRLGGPGGRRGSDQRFDEPGGVACRYHLRTGHGAEYVQLCFAGERLTSVRAVEDLNRRRDD